MGNHLVADTWIKMITGYTVVHVKYAAIIASIDRMITKGGCVVVLSIRLIIIIKGIIFLNCYFDLSSPTLNHSH
jgi:hypothetical protein